MIKISEKKTILIAVFCELREGLPNHSLLDTSKKLGDFLSYPEYQLIKLSDIACKVGIKKGSKSVVFEVYQIDRKTLEKINLLKTYYYEDYKNNLSEKILIDTPYGKAYIYMDVHSRIKNENMIDDYDYYDYINYTINLKN